MNWGFFRNSKSPCQTLLANCSWFMSIIRSWQESDVLLSICVWQSLVWNRRRMIFAYLPTCDHRISLTLSFPAGFVTPEPVGAMAPHQDFSQWERRHCRFNPIVASLLMFVENYPSRPFLCVWASNWNYYIYFIFTLFWGVGGWYTSRSRSDKKVISKKPKQTLTGSSPFPVLCASVAHQQLCISATTAAAVVSPSFVPVGKSSKLRSTSRPVTRGMCSENNCPCETSASSSLEKTVRQMKGLTR